MTEQLRLFEPPPPCVVGMPTVYFAKRLSAIKIGYTTNIGRRMTELGTTLLATVPGTLETEAAFHKRFRKHRIAYEWFSPAPELLDLIERLQTLAPDLAAAA